MSEFHGPKFVLLCSYLHKRPLERTEVENQFECIISSTNSFSPRNYCLTYFWILFNINIDRSLREEISKLGCFPSRFNCLRKAHIPTIVPWPNRSATAFHFGYSLPGIWHLWQILPGKRKSPEHFSQSVAYPLCGIHRNIPALYECQR